MISTGYDDAVFSVTFHPDGIHLFSGCRDGIRRWRVADGQEVGKKIRQRWIGAISVSRDHNWIACGTGEGASIWNAKTQERTIAVEGTKNVCAVDVSPDSTRFATGTGFDDEEARVCIWDIKTGARLVGPLRCNRTITAGVKFSPNGEQIAIAVSCHGVKVLDSRTGDQLIFIKAHTAGWVAITPLAWLNNGQQILVTRSGKHDGVIAFDVSTGSQLAELRIHTQSQVVSIALAANGKFLATFAFYTISFWDTSTLASIGPVIVESQEIRSIALSQDCSYLATGGFDGNIKIRNLSGILPDSYGPFHVSVCAFIMLASQTSCMSSFPF